MLKQPLQRVLSIFFRRGKLHHWKDIRIGDETGDVHMNFPDLVGVRKISPYDDCHSLSPKSSSAGTTRMVFV